MVIPQFFHHLRITINLTASYALLLTKLFHWFQKGININHSRIGNLNDFNQQNKLLSE